MAPSRVDPNQKQAKSSIDQVEEDPFCFDRMAKTVSAQSQATVHLAKRTPQDLYYECLDEGEAWGFPIPNLLYKINMQTRYAAARATVTQYTRPVPIPKNTFSPYGNSDEDSDGPPPSPKKTDATEMKIDKYLQDFIEASPHLEPLHYGFKLQALKRILFLCSCKMPLSLEKKHHVDNDYSVCGARHFQGPGLHQYCPDKGDEYHTATASYLTTLFKNGMGLTQAAVHHGTNDQSRQTADANEQISGHYYQSVDSQESDHPYQVNESIVDNACDTVGKDTLTLSGHELPGQRAHDNDGVNSVDKATDANGDPSKDSDHTIDGENTTVDEPDCTLDSVEVNTVGEANDTNGHPSQESDVTVDAENCNIDELDIIHDSSKTIDTNVEQTEPIVHSDEDRNDVSQKELPVQSTYESEEVNTVDKATDVNGDPSKDSDHTIDAENMTVDEPDRIVDSVEVNTVGEENDVHGHCSQETGV
jgi:hypothetical protein